MDSQFTHDEIAAYLRVENGVLFWRIDKKPMRAGARAGRVDRHGHIGVQFKRRMLQAHRVVWLLTHGEWPGTNMMIDHINGNRADNRPSNLRLATSAQNTHNKQRQGAVPFKGVVLHKSGRYQASCKHKYLGLFKDAESAARAYDAQARQVFGEFARLNFEEQG